MRYWGSSSNWTENRGKPEPFGRRLLTDPNQTVEMSAFPFAN
jgi:hypothetical protein